MYQLSNLIIKLEKELTKYKITSLLFKNFNYSKL